MNKLVAFTAEAIIGTIVAFALADVAQSAEPGPQVGERFPHSLEAFDQTGRQHNLETLMGDKGLAVLFVRSADWCPFCKRQLVEVNQRLPEFQALGINVATVSVDKFPLLAEFAKSQAIGYRMLADPDGAINLSLGIRDEQYPVGTAQFGVPRPVLYVLDRSGTVRLRYMEPTYRTRPDLNVVLRDAAGLGF